MHTYLRRMLLAGALLTLGATACSRDPQPGTPAAAAEGERLMRQMSDTLAKVPAFRFSTTESLEQVGPSSERRVLRFSRTLTVRRPDAMHFELHGTAGTLLDVAGSYEHGALTLRDGIDRVWAQTTVPTTLDQMLDDVARRYGLPVPVADVVYSVPYDAFIGRTTKGGLVGRETIDGVDCVQLSYTDEFVDVRILHPVGRPAAAATGGTGLQAGAGRAEGTHRLHELGPRAADRRRDVQVGRRRCLRAGRVRGPGARAAVGWAHRSRGAGRGGDSRGCHEAVRDRAHG